MAVNYGAFLDILSKLINFCDNKTKMVLIKTSKLFWKMDELLVYGGFESLTLLDINTIYIICKPTDDYLYLSGIASKTVHVKNLPRSLIVTGQQIETLILDGKCIVTILNPKEVRYSIINKNNKRLYLPTFIECDEVNISGILMSYSGEIKNWLYKKITVGSINIEEQSYNSFISDCLVTTE
jgi:hypothetical protein